MVLAAVKRRGVRVSVVAGNPSSRTVLASSEVRLQQADAVMLCGLEAREETAGDMQVRGQGLAVTVHSMAKSGWVSGLGYPASTLGVRSSALELLYAPWEGTHTTLWLPRSVCCACLLAACGG